MVRLRSLRWAAFAGLGLLCGCACRAPGSFLWRLTHPFSRFRECSGPVEGMPVSAAPITGVPVAGSVVGGGMMGEGPILIDPGHPSGAGCPTALPSFPPHPTPVETAPPPRSFPPGEATRMPYQP